MELYVRCHYTTKHELVHNEFSHPHLYVHKLTQTNKHEYTHAHTHTQTFTHTHTSIMYIEKASDFKQNLGFWHIIAFRVTPPGTPMYVAA